MHHHLAILDKVVEHKIIYWQIYAKLEGLLNVLKINVILFMIDSALRV